MARGELENRDKEFTALGELPEELADERGDLDTYSEVGEISASSADVRIASEARDEAARTGSGAPQIDFNVRSIFDSRPVNGYDFNQFSSAELAGPGSTIVTSLTIPVGFIGVVRRVDFWLEPLIAAFRSEITMTPRVAGLQVQNNLTYPVGNMLNEPMRAFYLADENQTLSFLITSAIALPALTIGNIVVYGNLLLKTGVPTNFQIANPAGTQPPAVVVSAGDIANAGAATDAEAAMQAAGYVTRKRRRRAAFADVPMLGTKG
jgi:hypothetical protein